MGASTHAARAYLYRVFQYLLGNEPDAAMLAGIDAELVREACEIAGLEAPEGLLDAMAAAGADPAELDALRSQHMRALVGPAKLASPPWESAQLSGDGALFSRITLDVRNAYRVQGLLPEGYPSVADDHVALECAFLAELASRAQQAAEAGDADAERASMEAGSAFLADHLGRWVRQFADGMDAQAAPFYAEASQALAQLADQDARLLAEALA